MNLRAEVALTTDAKEILALQKLAYRSEAELHDDFTIAPLHQSFESMLSDIQEKVVLKVVSGSRIVGSVRGVEKNDTCYIGRLIVLPSEQGKGIGGFLLREIEDRFQSVRRYELFTGILSVKNIGMYERRGYTVFRTEPHLVFLEKMR